MTTDIIGNAGTIVFSQFNPYGNGVIGSEWWNVGVSGPVNVNLTTSPVTSGSGGTPSPTPQQPANTGLIAFSQFNAGGYFKIGSQLKDIRLGGGLTVNDYDESVASASETIPTTATITTAAGVVPISPALPTNIGDVISSQFNDFGFGPIGLQLTGVQAGGGLSITNQTLLRNPDGSIANPSTGSSVTPSAVPPPIPTVDLRTNSGLVQNTQFNDGGFGKLGIQWDNVQVKGSIAVSSQTYAVEPGVANPFGPTPYPKPRPNGRTYGDPSNTGTLKNTQFNDGGFGDVGMQWKNVKVGGQVSTSTNALSIQPSQSNVGPFSVGPLVFGQGGLTAVPISPAAASGTASAPAASTVAPSAVPIDDPTKNEATNSGLVLNSQFDDGGFGDVGMQWLDVAVKGNVSTVDNSLSIQPENQDQGLITVQGIQFPSNPSSPTPQPTVPFHVLPPTPTPVSSTGTTPSPILPTPTKPGATSFDQNDATNSGNVLDSQVSDGGFGDIGLQWAHVKVGAVKIIHNSFSIHPEDTNLAGVNVSNVVYGDANPKNAKARAAANRQLATLPTTVIDPSTLTPPPTPTPTPIPVPVPVQPKNHGDLDNVQFPKILTAPLSLQWYGVVTSRGLVLVHNTIQIKVADPATTGLITLSGIRMPGPIPAPTIEVTTNAQPQAQAAMTSSASSAPSIDASTNSGVLLGSQFSDGGFGDIGTQFRKVKIHGTVSVVHNTMSVDVTGTNTGPISVSNLAFYSGALDGAKGIRIITPPSYWNKLQIGSKGSAKALGHSAAVVDNASNSGILDGGQFATGGMGHIMLQWQKVGIPGSVTILDNVLSISITGHQTAPITISNVTFS